MTRVVRSRSKSHYRSAYTCSAGCWSALLQAGGQPRGSRPYRALIVLTERGRDLLDAKRRDTADPRQEFYGGLRKPKELTHDAQVYRAYLRAADQLREKGANIRRIVLDNELKRDYQRFLQERNRGKKDSDGRPDRTPEEIHLWAVEHELPDEDRHVQFPELRSQQRSEPFVITFAFSAKTTESTGATSVRAQLP